MNQHQHHHYQIYIVSVCAHPIDEYYCVQYPDFQKHGPHISSTDFNDRKRIIQNHLQQIVSHRLAQGESLPLPQFRQHKESTDMEYLAIKVKIK